MPTVTRTQPVEPSLTYELSSEPFPLKASPPNGDLTPAALTIVASNQNCATAHVKSVSISFDVQPPDGEDDATNLTRVGEGIEFAVEPNPHLWSLSNDNAGNLTATARAKEGVAVAGEGIAFLIANVLPNRAVGTSELTIKETLHLGHVNTTTLLVSKFPHQFALTNLRADAGSVSEGGSTVLRWEGGGGADLTIFYADLLEHVNGRNEWSTPGLTRDTEFVLQASVGPHALASHSVEVQVTEPIHTLTQLTVRREAIVQGHLTVSGGARVTNGLDTDRLGVEQGLRVSGGGAEIAGGLTALGGPVALMADGIAIQFDHAITASTDGFLFGSVTAPDEWKEETWGTLCWGGLWLWNRSNGTRAAVTGGHVRAMVTIFVNIQLSAMNNNSAILPIRKGQVFEANAFGHKLNQVAPLYSARWIPFGF